MTNGSLMKVESIAESSPWSIVQYFLHVLSDNWSWKPIFGLFESGRFTKVLLYPFNYVNGVLKALFHFGVAGKWPKFFVKRRTFLPLFHKIPFTNQDFVVLLNGFECVREWYT